MIHSLIEPIIATADREHWPCRLEAAGVPRALVNTLASVLAHPHVQQFDLFETVPGSDALFSRLPITIDGARGLQSAPAPLLVNTNGVLLHPARLQGEAQ